MGCFFSIKDKHSFNRKCCCWNILSVKDFQCRPEQLNDTTLTSSCLCHSVHYLRRIVNVDLFYQCKIMRRRILSIFRNFALVKLFFALLTSYLLYEELFTFWIEKPTFSSSSKIKIGAILGFNLTNVQGVHKIRI